VSDTFATRNAGRPLEELVRTQALSIDLREAVMACLAGGESRRWTIAELLERFKNLGICASRASVTAALAELGLEIERVKAYHVGSWLDQHPGSRSTQRQHLAAVRLLFDSLMMRGVVDEAARVGYGSKKNEGKNTRYRCTQRQGRST
jgi:hypothetical protein